MDSILTQTTTCQTTMKLLGDYWTLRIVDSLQHCAVRFCQLQRNLGNLNPVTLTNRLKKLEDSGLIVRTEAGKDKISVEYSLTELGREVLPVIRSLNNFASKANNVK